VRRIVRGAPCGLGVGIALFASVAAAQRVPERGEAEHDNEIAISATPSDSGSDAVIPQEERREEGISGQAPANPMLRPRAAESPVPHGRSTRSVVGALPIPERVYVIESLRVAPDLVRVPIDPRRTSPWLAAGIAATLQVAIWSWSRFVTEDDWARISPDSWRANLRGPWIFDRSNYATNQFAHPYHGSLSFTAARASGLGFWASLPYPLVASTLWELFGETEPPAINDAITTPVGGALLGEALHRIAALFLDAGGARPGLGWTLAAAAVDPVGGAVRLVAGERFRARDVAPIPAHLELSAGASFSGRAEVGERNVRTAGLGFLQARVTHGLPVPGWRLRRPFDHFDLSLVLVLAAKPWFQLTLRGLLLGASWEYGISRGFYGLFGVFEALAPPVFRTATSALAFGATQQWAHRTGLALALTGLAGLGFGAGGPDRRTEAVRDSHFGLDVFLLAEARVFAADRGALSVAFRQHFLGGAISEDALGSEWIGYLLASARVRVWDGHSLGVDLSWGFRRATFGNGLPDANDRFDQVIGVYAWSPDGSLPSGLAVARPAPNTAPARRL
jgi:hypothetical protein